MMNRAIRYITMTCLVAAVLVATGCDSTTGPETQGDVTFEGRVTDESGFGKSGSAASVEGAVVTASNVSAEGSTSELSGEATTNTEGQFSLDVDGAASEVVLVATKGTFRSKTMAHNRGRTTIRTIPMTSETHAEADVFVEARRQDDEDDVTMSDVAVYVTERVGADVRSGSRSAADVAAALRAEAQAKKSYVRDEAGDDEAEAARSEENEAFLELQAELSASTDAEAEAAAVQRFESALIQAYSNAGVSLETQARARQAARSALVQFGTATFEMRKQAQILASLATAHAVESSFEAEGASEARIDALAQARTTLISELRAASSANAVANARANYASKVRAELASEANVEESALATASTAMEAAEATLEVALTTAASARAVANAHAAFYASAESSAESALNGSTAKASLAAHVLALLSL